MEGNILDDLDFSGIFSDFAAVADQITDASDYFRRAEDILMNAGVEEYVLHHYNPHKCDPHSCAIRSEAIDLMICHMNLLLFTIKGEHCNILLKKYCSFGSGFVVLITFFKT
jgi:hypothetical protein